MTTVKTIIDKKSNTIFSVSTTEPVENVLKVMRDFRVRAVLVIDDGVLMGLFLRAIAPLRYCCRTTIQHKWPSQKS
jgi:CBS domain-containing protein